MFDMEALSNMRPVKETMISRVTWDRIQRRLNQPEVKAPTRQQVVDRHLEKMERNRFPSQKRMPDPKWLKQKEEREAQKVARKEHRDRMVAEEIEFKQQERQKLLDRVSDMKFQGRGDVKNFNRQIQSTYAQLENEALMNLRREKMKREEDECREYEDRMRRRHMEVQKQEQEKTRQQQLRKLAFADEQRLHYRQKQLLEQTKKYQEKQEEETFLQMQKRREQEIQNQTRMKDEARERLRKERQEEISKRQRQRELEAQRMKEEEEDRKRYQSHMAEKQRLIQKRETEIMKRPQVLQEKMVKDPPTLRAQKDEMRRQKAIDDDIAREAKRAEEREKKTREMEKSIYQYNEENIRRKNEQKKAEQKANQDWLQAQIEADNKYKNEQKEKARRMREEKIKLNEANAAMIAEKRARAEQERKSEERATMKTREESSKMEERFKLYVHSELDKAQSEKRNVHLLRTTLVGPGLFTEEEESSPHQKLTAKLGGTKNKQPALPLLSNRRPQRTQRVGAPLVNESTRMVLPPITTRKKNTTILPAPTSKPKLRQNVVLPAISRR